MSNVTRPPVRGPLRSQEVSKARSSSTVRAREDAPWAPVKAPAVARSNVSTRVNDRLTEKARARRRQVLQRWAKRVAVVAVAAAAAWLVTLSPMFEVHPDAMEVTGFGTVIDRGEVSAVLEAYEGDSLVLLRTDRMAGELLALTGVRDVTIERVWPADLTITLVSREPVAAIPQDAEGFALVDQDGHHVGRVDTAPESVPVITVPLGPDNVRVLDAVLEVVAELPVELRERVEGISAQTEDSVTFDLRDGPRVEWGSSHQSPLKAEVLTVLLESDQAASADVIDVSAPTLPITRSED